LHLYQSYVEEENYMMARTQELLIIVLGVIAISSVWTKNEQALLLVIGILGGFLTNKTMTEKQTETLEKYQIEQYKEKEE